LFRLSFSVYRFYHSHAVTRLLPGDDYVGGFQPGKCKKSVFLQTAFEIILTQKSPEQTLTGFKTLSALHTNRLLRKYCENQLSFYSQLAQGAFGWSSPGRSQATA
jgi:hypothetical protein